MFKGVQQKWKVSGWQLLLIITTFAFGGSLCGYAGRKILGLFAIDSSLVRVILYILCITLLWPFCVLIISIPLGQFAFFKNYINRIGRRLFGSQKSEIRSQNNESQLKNQKPETINIAVFASGAGSNARAIINHFKNSAAVKIALIVSNKPEAGVLKIAEKENIPSLIIEKEKFFRGNAYVDELKEKGIDFIILAGFLWKVPSALIKAYPNKIVNIHPALLPKYGGKGMYGAHVHEAVIANKEPESGITIHYVDELYDHGSIILQAKCDVAENDTPESLAGKIHVLEHKHYPTAIETLLTKH
jgi:formyltetrahydrofolate-dependent phosphoribosylglycinamide formyltransferase